MKKGIIRRAAVCVKYWRTITNKKDYAFGVERKKSAVK